MENTGKMEQTLVLIKPDALKNSLTGYVLSQLSEFHTGVRFAGAKIVHVNRMLAAEHYAEHEGKMFYASLLDYITGVIHYPTDPSRRRVIALVYQGEDAIKKIRDICGPTNPHVAREQRPGCIRALGTVVPLRDGKGNIIGERMDNLIHASAATSDAEREIKLWFTPGDIPPFMHPFPTEVNEEYFYLRDDRLLVEHEPASFCFLSPGDIVWKSDMQTLKAIKKGLSGTSSLGSVAAKYLINLRRES